MAVPLGAVFDTFSRTELLKARDYPTESTNGNGHAVPEAVVEGTLLRCRVCGKTLSGRQKRTCSRECSFQLGPQANKASHAARDVPRRPRGTSPFTEVLCTFLEQLPPEVVAVELTAGWKCVRVARP
jgi:hypothetical protein